MSDLYLKRRGRFSLEFKLRYNLSDKRDRKVEAFTLDFHLFYPPSFRITPDTYHQERLYQNIRTFLQFNTPEFGTEELADPQSMNSPLARLERMVASQPQARNDQPQADGPSASATPPPRADSAEPARPATAQPAVVRPEQPEQVTFRPQHPAEREPDVPQFRPAQTPEFSSREGTPPPGDAPASGTLVSAPTSPEGVAPAPDLPL